MGFRPILYLLVMAWSVNYIPSSEARIPSLAFKGVTKYFKPGKKFYSPTLGIAAIESGLIHNLRFYGNFTAEYKELKDDSGAITSTRDYINDKGGDTLWDVLKILFPSSGGTLTVETESPHNFGKHVTTPKTVALILNYVHQLRFNKGISLPAQELAPPPPIQGKENTPPKKKKGIGLAPQHVSITLRKLQELVSKGIITNLTAAQKTLLDQASQNKDRVTKQPGQKSPLDQKIDLEEDQIALFLLNTQGGNQASYKAPVKRQPKAKAVDQGIDILADQIFASLTLTSSTMKSLLKKNIKALLLALKKSIDLEKDSLYPTYTTEQVVLAFFCEKFNSQQDIWKLIKALADLDNDHQLIQNREMIDIEGENLLREEDLEKLETITKPDLDDIYLLANTDIFYRPIPYKDSVSPISNGSTYPYNRQIQKTDEKDTFPDCIETLIRHIFNLLLYNPTAKNFNLSPLDIHNPYVKNLVSFYKYQSPLLANAGDIKTRSFWNTVVGDLNEGDIDPGILVNYSKGFPRKSYDMTSGFFNVITALEKIVPLSQEKRNAIKDIDAKTVSLEEAKEWIEAHLIGIFEKINPEHTYTLDTSNLRLEKNQKGNDAFGELGVKVKDMKGTKLFSFVLHMKVGHGELIQLNSNSENPYEQKIPKILKSFASLFQDNTTINSLKLLTPHMRKEVTEPLYQVYPQPLQDNWTVINSVIILSKMDKASYQETIKATLANLLGVLSWGDNEVLNTASPLMMTLKNIYPDVMKDHVKGFASNSMTNEQLQDILEFFPLIENLSLSGNMTILKLSVTNFPHLKTLNLSKSLVTKIEGLENLSHLQILNLEDTANLQKLNVTGLTNLTSLNLMGSAVAQINGMETLTSLRHADLEQTENITTLTLNGLTSLTSLNLSESGIEEIEGLETLISLETLSLADTYNLEELDLPNLPNLTEIILSASDISKLEGLENIPSLQELYLEETSNLSTLTMGNLFNLTKLFLSDSAISEIKGLETLHSLQELNLSNTRNLKFLSVQGLSNLSILNLNGSKIRKLSGLETLTSLEELSLMKTDLLQELSLNGLSSLKKIILSKSGIARIDGLKNLMSLQELYLVKMPKLHRLVLVNLPALTKIDLSNSPLITAIEGLETLHALEDLNLSGTSKLQELSLKGLNNLTTLNLANSGVTNVEGLKNLAALQHLFLDETENLTEISLEGLSHLISLNLPYSNIQKIEGLETLRSLQELNVRGTRHFKELSVIQLINLKSLDISHSSIEKIVGLENLPDLNVIE